MNLEEWLPKNLIYVTIHGSQAYGLNNELSDVDVKGICVPPRQVENDLFNRFDQAENHPLIEEKLGYLKNPNNPIFESTIFSLRKFFLLAANVNPNIIELLWTDENDHYIKSPLMEKLMEHRDLFLSSKAKFTFSGYAFAQAAKIERHRKWIVQGELEKPLRSNFGLPDEKSAGIDEVFGYIKSKVEQWNLNQFPLDEQERADLKETIWDLVYNISNKNVSWDNWPDAYTQGVIEKMRNEMSLKDEVIDLIQKERNYFKAYNNYKSWIKWKTERNPKRLALEIKSGYDCYSGDTEFLTDNGWKSFDHVTPELKLATVNPKTQRVEYHCYIEKFDGIFNGNLYHFNGTHTDILVTPNHKMWVRPRERNTHKFYDWQFVEASHLTSGFNVLRCITPLRREFRKWKLPLHNYSILKNVKRANLLKLIGWFVSEGCVLRNEGRIKGISISQLRGGRVHNHIGKCRGVDSELKNALHEYKHFREEKSRWEMTWNIYNRDVGSWFEHNCGAYSQSKKLPRWIMFLSKREKVMVLDAMIAGDGTNRPKDNSEIYYTSSKELANDTQELAFLCGFETSIWGPYDGMFHVHINRTRPVDKEMTRRSIEKRLVNHHRIVCFTVPNHLLVTRRNGKIGIQGNSKHASHLVRLMRMGYEILTEGRIIVKRPDRDEILAIKNGAWSYEQVIQFAKNMQVKLDEEYKKTKLPKSVNFSEVNALYHELVQEYHSND